MVGLTIRPAPLDRRADALAMLVASGDDATLADSLRSGAISEDACLPLDGLLIAETEGELLGAVLYVVQAGGVAFVWPPAIRPGPSLPETGLRLLEEVARRIDVAGCRLGQCLIQPDSSEGLLLAQAGFPRLTELLYLERKFDGPLPPLIGGRLETITYDPASNHVRFAALLDATYAGTLDCPELNGLRTADEALAGHRAAGEFDPGLWKLYQAAGQDIGLVLVVRHSAMRAREIVYMGVAPEARGHGVGGRMLADVLHAAHCAGCESVLLAVDARNTVARRLYDRLGFSELCRRAVHLRVCR